MGISPYVPYTAVFDGGKFFAGGNRQFIRRIGRKDPDQVRSHGAGTSHN